MRSILEIQPTTNFAVSSPADRWGDTEGLSRVLMGLSHPVTLITQCRSTTAEYDWPTPPRLTRKWLAVVTANDIGTLEWRTRTLAKTLDGIGLRCQEFIDYESHRMKVVKSDCVLDGYNSEQWCATLVLRRWPREVAPGWLGQALAGDLPVDVAIHVQPQDAQQVARFLKRQVNWQADGKDAGDELGRGDAERVRKNLIARVDKPCKVAIVLTVRAPDRDTLRTRVETLQHEVGLSLADIRLAKFEQDRGLLATLPTGECRVIGAFRTLDCMSVASTWTIQPATVNHENGVDLGTTREGSMVVRLDPFDMSLEGSAGVIVAKKRVGKSYFMKILIRGMVERGVEVNIIEQRNPPEYQSLTALPNVNLLNIADMEPREQVAQLKAFTSNLWDRARTDVPPRPRLLVVDEAWALLRDPELAAWVELVARTGGHFHLSLWVITQQVRELLSTGRAVLDNTEIRVYLKQHDQDLEALCDAVGLPAPGRKFLRGASRGQALLDVGGVLVPMDVATPSYHQQITTDPREMQNGIGAQAVVA